MKIKDYVRLLWAKIQGKKIILFTYKKDWVQVIKRILKSQERDMALFFYDFDQIKTNRFDYIIPLSVYAQEYVNKHKIDDIENKALITPQKCIDICDKKNNFEEFMINNGFEKYYPLLKKETRFPYVVKKNVDEFGLNVKIIENEEDENKYSDLISSKEYIKQDCVSGKEEYTAHIIINNNKIVYLNTLVYVFEQDIFIKGKYCAEKDRVKVNHDHFSPIFQEILSKMEYTQGICCFNYKLVDGVMKIFEINPRFGGSLLEYVDEALFHYMKILDNKSR